MQTVLLPFWLSLLGLLPTTVLAEDPPQAGDSKPKKPAKPVDPECTVTSPHSENFFDLRKLRRLSNATPPQSDWIVKGLDYGANFSINICGPVIADASGAQGVGEEARGSVAAFYEMNGTMYSIGSVSTLPRFRGRKLVLAYENGSPCPDAPAYRKSSLMSLMCDHEQFSKPSVSFVGQMNDCAYFFEVRTAAACATINQAQALGPGAVFGAIMGVFAVVYLVGGIVYQRTVMHARGWRQIPHYHAWSAALGFIWDLIHSIWTFIIERLPLPSSLRPRNHHGFGPRTVAGDALLRGAHAGRGGRAGYADENQLIDELDDDWGEDNF